MILKCNEYKIQLDSIDWSIDCLKSRYMLFTITTKKKKREEEEEGISEYISQSKQLIEKGLSYLPPLLVL